MRTYRQWLDYRELELISIQQPEPERKHLRVLSVLKGIANSLLAALSAESQGNACGGSGNFLEQAQLRIWQTTDRCGHLWWNIYDPITRQSIQLPSEQEVRIWIDQSYSRRRALTTPNLKSYWFSHLRG